MISVIIPSYNRAKTILRAIESVLNQTYSDIEVIVVDDGSKDNTKEVVSQITDSRVRYYYKENGGACSARNYGVRLAVGDYIAFHDSDDVWKTTKLALQMEIFDKYDVDVVVCKMNKYVNQVFSCVIPENIDSCYISNVKDIQGIGTQTIIGKRHVFENIQFDLKMPRLQDLEWLIRANDLYKIYCLDQPLVDYFIGEDSISSNPEKLKNAIILLLNKYKGIQKKYPNMLLSFSLFLKEEGQRYAENGNKLCIEYWQVALKCLKGIYSLYGTRIKLCLWRNIVLYSFLKKEEIL